MTARMMVRGVVVAAVTAGAAVPVVLLGAPNAAADPCPNGTARVFLGDETNVCQGAGTQTYVLAGVSKVCSMTSTDVTIDIDSESKKLRRHVEISNGQCAQFQLRGQTSATVTVTPN